MSMVSQTNFIGIILIVSVLMTTYAGVEFFRRKVGIFFFLDIPNERSSHHRAVPRGGGIIISIVCLIFLLIFQSYQGTAISWGYLCGGALVATIGLADDFRPLPFSFRLVVQILAAFLLIFQNGFFESLQIPFAGNYYLGRIGLVISLGWIIWMINAYNFMDGIDGMASLQAISAGFGWFVAGYYFESGTAQFLGGLIAFSAFGFYLHNRSPAKIFMGDAGSTFLGFTFAALPFLVKIENNVNGNPAFLCGIMLVYFFLMDTVFTLFRRIGLKESVWLPHRTHIYQKIIEKRFSHTQTGLMYFMSSNLVGIIFLCGLFYASFYLYFSLIIAVIISFILLFIGFKNQKPEKTAR